MYGMRARRGRRQARGRAWYSIAILCGVLYAIAALLPVYSATPRLTTVSDDTPHWPQSFAGRRLSRLALSEQEQVFGRDFPGHIARFSDGYREIIMRSVRIPTRLLHPAADCLKGAGYTITPQPLRLDTSGQPWHCVQAAQGGKRLQVCESIQDPQGRRWSDVSTWYWAALLGQTHGPWLAVTIAEP
jgi:hypothetical protein